MWPFKKKQPVWENIGTHMGHSYIASENGKVINLWCIPHYYFSICRETNEFNICGFKDGASLKGMIPEELRGKPTHVIKTYLLKTHLPQRDQNHKVPKLETLKEYFLDEEWIDIDIVEYFLCVLLGILPGKDLFDNNKGIFWSNNPVGNCIADFLFALTELKILIYDKENVKFKWNKDFKLKEAAYDTTGLF
jgi:hypothetical protein